jgi:predicted  nucleic acid-binding Zn-ribbon protein
MLSQEQINKIISENEYLRVQLRDANEMLALREEEIEILQQKTTDIAELRSKLEGELIHAQSLQNVIGKKQQQALGAANREKELEDELIDAAKLLKQNSLLQQQYTQLIVQIKDLEERLIEMNKRNEELEKKLNNNITLL